MVGVPSKTSGAARTRRQKRAKIRDRYFELRYTTPVNRVRKMYEEFGPFWAKLMLDDTILTQEERDSPRNQEWWKKQPTR